MQENIIRKSNWPVKVIVFLFILIVWPFITENTLYEIVVRIRSAITENNSSLLIHSTVQGCVLFMTPSFSLYMLLESIRQYFFSDVEISELKLNGILFSFYAFLLFCMTRLASYPAEYFTALLGLALTLIFVYYSSAQRHAFLPKFFIGFQVFFFVQWMNIIPKFTQFHLGMHDLSASIKIASLYLKSSSDLNQIAFMYMMPLMISSFMTALLVRLHINNMQVTEEKHAQDIAFEDMKLHVMNNRIYQEINALAHDLKTPLATVQGLSSLLTLSKDVSKIDAYGKRIESATTKMSDMISSFLCEEVREVISVENLVQYIRAQLPLEEDCLRFEVDIHAPMDSIEVNRIRMARAIVNILENAILAPTNSPCKRISLTAWQVDNQIFISVGDNGMGIHEDNLDKIWEIGYSSKQSSGLGLPFARQTIEENSGTISIESIYTVGTTVLIQLPAAKGAHDENL